MLSIFNEHMPHITLCWLKSMQWKYTHHKTNSTESLKEKCCCTEIFNLKFEHETLINLRLLISTPTVFTFISFHSQIPPWKLLAALNPKIYRATTKITISVSHLHMTEMTYRLYQLLSWLTKELVCTGWRSDSAHSAVPKLWMPSQISSN